MQPLLRWYITLRYRRYITNRYKRYIYPAIISSARSRRISIRVGMYVDTYVCIDCGTKKNKGTAIYRLRISERSPASRATATTRVASQILKGIDRDYGITSIVTA